MKKIDVLWLIEHVAREMDVACAVKYLAGAKYGMTIEIKHIYLHAQENLKTYRPKIVVLPFFYNSKDAGIEDCVRRWPSSIFFNLAWEEIFYKGHLQIKAPADDFTRHAVIHHSWGNFFKEYLIQNGVAENNIFLNGNPAYQLYLSPYNRYYADKRELAQKYGLDPEKRWIIVPENYRWAFIKDSTINWRVTQGAEHDELTEMRRFAAESLSHLLKWCNETAKHHQLEIIFRPKPATMLSEMEDFFKEHVPEAKSASLHFIKEESVREWILASDVVISSFSTTLIEAAIAGRPAYMVEPLPISESFSAEWYEHVPRIRSENEFKTACLETANPEANSLKTWAEHEMLAHGDPISNLADYIHVLTGQKSVSATTYISNQNKAGLSGIRFKKDYLNLRKFPGRFISVLRLVLNHKKKNYFNIRTHENDAFDENYTNLKVKEWRNILQSKGK